MTENRAKPKPLWWRVGKGKWHEDSLTYLVPLGRRMNQEDIRLILQGKWRLDSQCGFGERGDYDAHADDVQTRRAALPVAEQCKRCRAAKAKLRKERGK